MDRPTIDKHSLALFLSLRIRECVHGEEGLVTFAREIVHGDAQRPLPDESVEAVGGILWERTHAGDMAHKARQCGYLSALFDLAQSWEIELPDDVCDLKPWCHAIFPL